MKYLLRFTKLKNSCVNSYPEVIIYYAGHGIVYEGAHCIFASEYQDVENRCNQLVLHGLAVEKIVVDISEIDIAEGKKRSIAAILDTCRTTIESTLRSAKSDFIVFFEGNSKFDSHHETKIGILVCHACALGKGARDSSQHGLYTKIILEKCFESNAPIIHALGNANERVTQTANLSQRPQLDVNIPHYFPFSLVQQESLKDDSPRDEKPTIELSEGSKTVLHDTPIHSFEHSTVRPGEHDMGWYPLHARGRICIRHGLYVDAIIFGDRVFGGIGGSTSSFNLGPNDKIVSICGQIGVELDAVDFGISDGLISYNTGLLGGNGGNYFSWTPDIIGTIFAIRFVLVRVNGMLIVADISIKSSM